MFASVLLAVALAAAPSFPKSMELDVGAQKLLELPGIERVAVGDPAIADVKPIDGKQLLIVGKGEGNTTLLVWTGGHHAALETQLHVRTHTGAALEQTLRQILPGADLTVTILNGKRVVQGQVYSLDDLRKLHALVDGKGDIVLLVKLERGEQHRLIARINAELQKEGLRDAKAELVGSEIFLEGNVDDEADRQKAQLIAESIAAAQP